MMWLDSEVKLYSTSAASGWSSGSKTLVLTTFGAVIPLSAAREVFNEKETVRVTHSLFLEYRPEWLTLNADRVEHKGIEYIMTPLRDAGNQNRFIKADLRRVK
jgi:hypothetical protein